MTFDEYNLRMGRRKTTPTIEAVAAYTEEAATEIFTGAAPIDIPKLTWAVRIWGRDLFCAVMDEKSSEEAFVALEIVRKTTAKHFRRPITVVAYVGGGVWNYKRAEDRAQALIQKHGGKLN